MAGVVVVPDDLITDILAKLPVKSLLRFSCVCKTWYSTISDHQFSNSLHRLRPCVLISEELTKHTTITSESLLTTEDRAPTPHSLPWETEPRRDNSKNLILGSCNGLVCVRQVGHSPTRKDLILWNPSTKKFKKLPRPGCYSNSSHNDSCIATWFGYDESIDDYKLVLLYRSGAHVFTLKSNIWRSPPVDHIALGSIEFFFKRYESHEYCYRKSIGVLSNGAIHWIQPSKDRMKHTQHCILALDLATEKFRVLEFSHATRGLFGWVGSSLDGCLCLSGYGYENGRGVINIWMMKEYGVESSWTKLLSMPIPSFSFTRFYPILFSEEDKEIVAMCDSYRYFRGCRIVKFRVEGSKNVKFEETLMHVTRQYQNAVILHMEESLVSLN